MNQRKTLISMPGILAALVLLFLFLTLGLMPNNTRALSASQSTDLRLNISPVIALTLTNCPSAPDPDETSLTLNVQPVPSGTFHSNCQTVSVDTNAPGYTLLTKASGSHPQVNSGSLTNALIYQNPTTLVSPNYPIIAATASPISSPSVLTPNYWGFAVDQSGTNVSLSSQPTANFDGSYTVNNAGNKFAQLPTTDTIIYQTLDFPGQLDTFKFFYGVNLNAQTVAGTYQTTVTYTAVAEDVPPLPCNMLGEVICYTIDSDLSSTPGTHNVGTWGGVANIWNHQYDWDIFVNNQPITDCNGSNYCSGDDGSGFSITVPTTGQHQVKILPHNGPEPGWGNAFIAGENVIISVDAPLTTMAFAPKPSESTTDASYMFSDIFSWQDFLTTPIKIKDTYKLPNTITDLSYFLAYAQNSNSSLTEAIDLSSLDGWLVNNSSITDMQRFLYEVHSFCDFIENTVILPQWSFTNMVDLSYFMSSVHMSNNSLLSSVDITPLSGWFNNNNTIADLGYFFNCVHCDNPSNLTPIDFSPISGWFSGNNTITNLEMFLDNAFSSTPSMTTAVILSPFAGWFYHNTSITNISDFLYSTHYDSGVSQPIYLTPLYNWFLSGRLFSNITGFLGSTHADNPNLVLSGQTILPNWLASATQGGTDIWNVPGTFGFTFAKFTSTPGDTGEVKFQSGDVLSSLGTPTPTNKKTYQNRTDIEPVNDNWQ